MQIEISEDDAALLESVHGKSAGDFVTDLVKTQVEGARAALCEKQCKEVGISHNLLQFGLTEDEIEALVGQRKAEIAARAEAAAKAAKP